MSNQYELLLKIRTCILIVITVIFAIYEAICLIWVNLYYDPNEGFLPFNIYLPVGTILLIIVWITNLWEWKAHKIVIEE